MHPTEEARRRWSGKLAAAMPGGPQGQPAHTAGAVVSVIDVIEVQGFGAVSFTVPRLSSLLLETAQAHGRSADRLRARAAQQTKRGQWSQPGIDRDFSNETLLFDALRETAAAVVCSFASVDNLANELIPVDFVYSDPAGKRPPRDRTDLEASSGVELRLSRIAAAATGRENIRIALPEIWAALMQLKTLRDDISHAKADQVQPRLTGTNERIFNRLFNAPVQTYLLAVAATADHYLR